MHVRSQLDTCRTSVERNGHFLKMVVSDSIVPQVTECLNCALSDFYSNHKCETVELFIYFYGKIFLIV
jgi:hypothetical protein